METPAQLCARLLTALEDLVAREAAALTSRDFAAMIAAQERAGPLLELLGEHVATVTGARLRPRLEAVAARRRESAAWLNEEIERTRADLARMQASRNCVAQVIPVYGRIAPPRRQLCEVG